MIFNYKELERIGRDHPDGKRGSQREYQRGNCMSPSRIKDRNC